MKSLNEKNDVNIYHKYFYHFLIARFRISWFDQSPYVAHANSVPFETRQINKSLTLSVWWPNV